MQVGNFLEHFDRVQEFLIKDHGWNYRSGTRRIPETWSNKKKNSVYRSRRDVCAAVVSDKELLETFMKQFCGSNGGV